MIKNVTPDEKFEVLLIERGLIDPSRLSSYKHQAAAEGEFFYPFLLKKEIIEEENLIFCLHEALSIPVLSEVIEEAPALDSLPENILEILKERRILPFKKTDEGLHVALNNPYEFYVLDELANRLNSPLKMYLAKEDVILKGYAAGSASEGAYEAAEMWEITDDLEELEVNENLEELLTSNSRQPPVIRFVNHLFLRAVSERASDIHIESFESLFRIRFRIDGLLQDIYSPPKSLLSPVLSRLKVMAGLNVAERRRPQEGRIKLRLSSGEVDVRVSVIPSSEGGRAVLRILDRAAAVLPMEKLGLAPHDLARVEGIIHKTNGIILVTGPTGSGKTTTLYAVLNRINTAEKNIITIEDPIEYKLEGISQMQVNPELGFGFAEGLRSVLRQDPDVLMVGEIRDPETAKIAVQASATGHLVFSTMHTNDSIGALFRLLDLHSDAERCSETLRAVIAQRLVRTLCPHCSQPAPPPEELKKLELEEQKFRQPRGCPECRGTGYKGRTGLFEILLVDDRLQTLIRKKAGHRAIKKYAESENIKFLADDAIIKTAGGITSWQECKRVAGI